MRILKNVFDHLKTKKVKTLDVILTISLLIGYILYFAIFSDVPLESASNIKINLGYMSLTDKDNNTYIIDQGKSRIIKISNGKVEFEIYGSPSHGFYQAEDLEFGNNGEFYVHSICWDNSGFLLENEKIIKYNSSGKYIDTIYEVMYTPEQEINKHNLFDLRKVDDGIEFIKADNQGFQLVHISTSREYTVKQSYNFEDTVTLIQDFALDTRSGNIYLADKRGRILYANTGEINLYCDFEDEMVTPYSIDLGSDGSVYLSDVYNSSINRVTSDKSIEEIVSKKSLYPDGNISGNEGLITTVSVNNVIFSDDLSKDVISTIYNDSNVYSVTHDGQVLINDMQFKKASNYLLMETAVYVLLGLCILCVIYLVLRIFSILIFNKFKMKLLYKIEITIVLTVIIVSSIILPMILPNISSIYKESLASKLLVVSTIASNNLDAEIIESINTPADFMDEDYRKLIGDMQKILTENISSTERMGAQIEKYENGVGYSVAYPDTSISSYYPLDKESANNVKTIYEEKQPIVKYLDVTGGSFIFARTPILNSDGDVVAVVNIAKDSIIIDRVIKNMLINIIIDLILILIAAIFILNEVISFISQRNIYRNRNKSQNKDTVLLNGKVLPFHMVRLSAFTFNMTLNIASSFLPVYILMFYSEQLGIPKALVGTIPLFLNSALITFSAIICPILLRKFRFLVVTVCAASCTLIGDIMMATSGAYYLIVIALFLNGIGYGLLDNSIYIYLTDVNEDRRQDAMSTCSSSSSAGTNCGLTIGAFLASIFTYNNVFWFSAFAWLLSLLMCVYLGKYMIKNRAEVIEQQNNINIFKFLFSRDILSYILCISITYGIISGFIYYYIPMYGNKSGLNERQVSLLMIICTLCGVFLKTPLSKIVKRIFNKNSIYLAITISLGVLLIISYFNSIYILVAGLLILGVAASFGGNVCTTYFLDNDKSKQYGVDKSLGVYNFTLGIGDAFSPMIFGSVIAAGLATGMSVFAGISFAAMLTYKVLFDRKHKTKK